MILSRTSLLRLRTLAYISNLSTSAVAAGCGDKESPVNRSSPFVAPPATMAWSQHLHNTVSAKELIYVQAPDESHFVNVMQGESWEQKRMKRFRLWQSLFANPDEWDDYRKIKKSTVHPDFKHKKTRERLWLNADDPSWIKEHLVLLDSRLNVTLNVELPFGSFTSNCVSSHQLASSDSTETGSLNLALGHCSNIGESLEQKHMRMLPLWRSLFANPDEWHDCRKTKKHCRQPDFIHKKTNEALWLNPEDPSWVKKHVELLDSELTEC